MSIEIDPLHQATVDAYRSALSVKLDGKRRYNPDEAAETIEDEAEAFEQALGERMIPIHTSGGLEETAAMRAAMVFTTEAARRIACREPDAASRLLRLAHEVLHGAAPGRARRRGGH